MSVETTLVCWGSQRKFVTLGAVKLCVVVLLTLSTFTLHKQREGSNASLPSINGMTIMAVPSRNRTLVHCILQPHYSVQSAVAQIFCVAHTRYIDLSGIHASSLHVWAPPLSELLRYSALNVIMQSICTTEYCSISTQDCHNYMDVETNVFLFKFVVMLKTGFTVVCTVEVSKLYWSPK